jgi:hypothetical protein
MSSASFSANLSQKVRYDHRPTASDLPTRSGFSGSRAGPFDLSQQAIPDERMIARLKLVA